MLYWRLMISETAGKINQNQADISSGSTTKTHRLWKLSTKNGCGNYQGSLTISQDVNQHHSTIIHFLKFRGRLGREDGGAALDGFSIAAVQWANYKRR